MQIAPRIPKKAPIPFDIMLDKKSLSVIQSIFQ